MRALRVSMDGFAEPRPHLVVRVVDELGREGLGEAAPLPGFSSDSIAACRSALERWEPESTWEGIDDLSCALRGLESTPTAYAAAECALLDLSGLARGLPVGRLLGGPGRFESIAVNALIEAEPLASLTERAFARVAEGYRALKIKVRSTSDSDFGRAVERLTALRGALPNVEIRIDPNGVWPLWVARARLDALVPVRPAFVEEPCRGGDLLELSAHRVPWAADEALVDDAMVEALLARSACACVVLKPALLGGLLRARRVALRAIERGLGVVVTHFRDGPIGFSLARELAFSLPCEPRACGLAPHAELGRFGEAQGLPFAVALAAGPEGMTLERSRAPGLGLGAAEGSMRC